jgi:hypothetical protein
LFYILPKNAFRACAKASAERRWKTSGSLVAEGVGTGQMTLTDSSMLGQGVLTLQSPC